MPRVKIGSESKLAPSVVQTNLLKEMLRGSQIHPIAWLESLSQALGPRVPSRLTNQRSGRFNPIERLPLLGLRSQKRDWEGRFQSRGVTRNQYDARLINFAVPRQPEGTRTICQRRSERREQLFRMGIAGRNKRRSPGSGGRYKRTAESYYHCRKVR